MCASALRGKWNTLMRPVWMVSDGMRRFFMSSHMHLINVLTFTGGLWQLSELKYAGMHLLSNATFRLNLI